MGRAVWCDAKDAGHPVNEPDAIMVSGKAVTLFFCKGRCVPAFVTAFNTARNEGKSGIHLPTLVLQSGFVIFPVGRAGHGGAAWSCAW